MAFCWRGKDGFTFARKMQKKIRSRIAVLSILRLHPNSLVILAPVCSSFSFMCSSQAMRFFYNPEGDESIGWVKAANVMANRVTLLCWLAAALGHTFLVEQPSSARFGDMPRWRHFCDSVLFASCRTIQITILGIVFSLCWSIFVKNM